MKSTKDKWSWALIITGVMLLIFSATFANADLVDAGEGIRVGFMKMALGMGFMAAPFLAAIWFGFQGLLSGIICKDWRLLSGLAVSLLLYIPAFLLHFLFSMTVIHLFQIRSAIAIFWIFCSIPCVLLIFGLRRKPRMTIANHASEGIRHPADGSPKPSV